jgi:hypothetical protein
VVLDRGPLSGRARLSAAALALLLALVFLAKPVNQAFGLGDQLAEAADPYSESNAIRGAYAYLHKGLLADASLPETTFGRLYPETGHLRRYPGQRHVDTHYPPGPTWLAAAMRQACGTRPLSCLRALPLAVSGIGAFVLAFALIVTLGMARGLVVSLAGFAVPLYSNMMLGLHYQGYALALLSIQLGGLLFLYGTDRPLLARDLVLAGSLGFLQGWLSFDYFFLVALAAVPIAVLFSDLREPRARQRLLALVGISAGGFALAHALHFLQVIAYYGDFMAAVNDLLDAARERADPRLSAVEPPPEWASDPWMISSIFLFVLGKRGAYFGFSIGYALLLAVAGLALLCGTRLRLPGTGRHLDVGSSTRPAWAVVAAVVVSCAWIFVMSGHAFTHPHFIPRHLFLAWLVLLLALLSSVRLVGDAVAGLTRRNETG